MVCFIGARAYHFLITRRTWSAIMHGIFFPGNAMPTTQFEVTGTNAAALFTLKVHRGDGMALLAMNWKTGKPPLDFVGFAIEYQEPGGAKSYPLKNRLSFPDVDGSV